MTDTVLGHNSAFEAIWPGVGLKNESILLNGIGNVTRYNNNITNSLTIPAPYSVNFATRGKRYLLRLINTSFDSTFVFSIDNHMLQIIVSVVALILLYRDLFELGLLEIICGDTASDRECPQKSHSQSFAQLQAWFLVMPVAD